MANIENMDSNQWQSVAVHSTATGLTAREKFSRIRAQPGTEIALRAVGIAMVASALLIWFYADPAPQPEWQGSIGMLGSLLAAGGLGVFAFGSRGFSRQISLDIDEGTFSLTKINVHHQSRVGRRVSLGEIESVFLRRPETIGKPAMLLVRIKGDPAPAVALTGETAEIETLHRQLCAVMQSASGDRPTPRVHLGGRVAKKRKLFSS